MDDRTVVMFHYVKEGLVRSPNIIFDRMEHALDKNKYQIVHLNQKKLPSEVGTIRVIWELYKEIKEKKPDIIHISGIQEGFSCMIAAVMAGCQRRILITHGFASEVKTISKVKQYLFQHVIEPITLKLATIVQCNSWFSYNHPLVQRFAKNHRKMIYNIPLEEHAEYFKQNVRELYNIGSETTIFVSVGRVEKSKGFENLVEVIPQISNNSCFIIIGDGSYLEELRIKLKDEIDKNKVIVLGRIPNDEVYGILKECDVFVLPTQFETFGLVFIEAAYAMLPSIGTNIYAVKEVLKDGQTGKLIELNNNKQLLEAINWFVENPAKAKEMGKAAYNWAKETFDSQKIAQQIDEMYQELLR